jgi:hypothetical protein
VALAFVEVVDHERATSFSFSQMTVIYVDERQDNADKVSTQELRAATYQVPSDIIIRASFPRTTRCLLDRSQAMAGVLRYAPAGPGFDEVVVRALHYLMDRLFLVVQVMPWASNTPASAPSSK